MSVVSADIVAIGSGIAGATAAAHLAPHRRVALIEAEEQGITQANVEEKLTSSVPQVKRLLGVTGDFGKFMALDNRWAFNAIKAVGNFGEMYDRNFGPLKLPRGKNALWRKGGLLYSPPIR